MGRKIWGQDGPVIVENEFPNAPTFKTNPRKHSTAEMMPPLVMAALRTGSFQDAARSVQQDVLYFAPYRNIYGIFYLPVQSSSEQFLGNSKLLPP